MKRTQLEIRDIRIYERLKAESGVTAHVKNIAGHPSKLSSLSIATDDEKCIIDDYIELAASECLMTINHYLSPCNISEENDSNDTQYKVRHFSMTIPDTFSEGEITQIGNIIMDFICNRCLQQWYILVKSDDANISAIKAQSSMALLREILAMHGNRKKIRRRATDIAGI